jgi:actin-like ATPase involved in cell morphogenesis
VLTAGGALLPGLRERVCLATAIDVTIPQYPLDVVIKGILQLLDA